jgi:hypothetical protein
LCSHAGIQVGLPLFAILHLMEWVDCWIMSYFLSNGHDPAVCCCMIGSSLFLVISSAPSGVSPVCPFQKPSWPCIFRSTVLDHAPLFISARALSLVLPWAAQVARVQPWKWLCASGAFHDTAYAEAW